MKIDLTLRQQIKLIRNEPIFTSSSCAYCKYVVSASYDDAGYDLFLCPNHNVSSSFLRSSNKHNLIWIHYRNTTSAYCSESNANIFLKAYELYHRDKLVPLLEDIASIYII